MPVDPGRVHQAHHRSGTLAGPQTAGKKLAGGHAHAQQFRRLRGVLKRQHTILGRWMRKVRRWMAGLADPSRARLEPWVQRAERIQRQRPKAMNKLHALHAPEVEVQLATTCCRRRSLSVISAERSATSCRLPPGQ